MLLFDFHVDENVHTRTHTEYEIVLQKALSRGIEFRCALNLNAGNITKSDDECVFDAEYKIGTSNAHYCLFKITWLDVYVYINFA